MKSVATLMLLVGMMIGGLAQANLSPQAMVQQTADNMLSKLKEERALIESEPSRIYELVNQIVLPHFDFEYMSQLVVGKHWRKSSAQQRAAFVTEFRTLLVRTYATSLNQYIDQEIIYLPSRNKADSEEATVRTEIEQPGTFPIPIDYKVHIKDAEWLVFDVVIDGVSMVTNYRTTFAKEIRAGGLDALIASLAERNEKGME